jgi:choline dehydrogenase-like flavoprotein
MIHDFDAVRGGFDIQADAIVVGSGAGGAVAAANLAAAGLRTVVIEAGPKVDVADMTRDGPEFMRKYYWEGGLRMLLGSGTFPAMSGRCLGGSTVMNSAIMFALPRWVRDIWIDGDGLDSLRGPALDQAFERVFRVTRTATTPMAVMGKRNLMTRDVLDAAGMKSKPLARAVDGCVGSGDCLTGCAAGAKQSMDRSYLPRAVADGAEIFTCSSVERVLMQGTRAVGVEGHVVDPDTRQQVGVFRVHAPRVLLAAGAMHTPVLLLKSGIKGGGLVGGTFSAHISAFAMGIMRETVDPWHGATQGWGAFSDQVQGVKFESLWGPTALIAAQWGGLGQDFYDMLPDIKRALLIPLVYRGNVTGRVRAKRNGLPDARLWVPKEEGWVMMREIKRVVDVMLAMNAEYVNTGVRGVPSRIRTAEEAETLLSRKIRPRHLKMTCNHVFSSCRMSARADRGVVDQQGRVYGLDGLWLCDASIFPSGSAVNPQGTVMALSDMISRRIANLDLMAPAA